MAPTNKPVVFAFFDIGGTLGERDPATGKLIPFPSSVNLLTSVRNIGLRVGVITTLGSLSNSQGVAMLEQAGLAGFLDPQAKSGNLSVRSTESGGTCRKMPLCWRKLD